VSLQVLDEADVRRIMREERARPEYVTQRNVEAVIGLPRRAYLRAIHAGHFAHTRQGRLAVARTVDVISFFELRLRAAVAPVANDAGPEAIALARVGARRVAG
jgi:hypothetical protein